MWFFTMTRALIFYTIIYFTEVNITITGLGCTPDMFLLQMIQNVTPLDVALKAGKNVTWMHSHFGNFLSYLWFGKSPKRALFLEWSKHHKKLS